MAEVELTRVQGDRRLYALEGVGTPRLEGLFSSAATADAGGTTWRFARHGILSQVVEAKDAAGADVGRWEYCGLRRRWTVFWANRAYALRPASSWRERYALADGERELAVLDGKGWGKRPVKLELDDPNGTDPGLLLFAAFIVRGLAEDAAGAAGATSSTAATGA
jgi:hypothetical protein